MRLSQTVVLVFVLIAVAQAFELMLEQPRLIASLKGDVDLREFRLISDEVADALARHQGTLMLDGLTTLSETAEAA